MNQKENTKVHPDFVQVCVWEGTTLGEEDDNNAQAFVDYMKSDMGARVQFLECILTKPNKGDTSPDAGGRSDLFFAVHKEDLSKFAIPRLKVGIRWVEDVLSKGNYRSPIYPPRVFEYTSWEA